MHKNRGCQTKTASSCNRSDGSDLTVANAAVLAPRPHVRLAVLTVHGLAAAAGFAVIVELFRVGGTAGPGTSLERAVPRKLNALRGPQRESPPALSSLESPIGWIRAGEPQVQGETRGRDDDVGDSEADPNRSAGSVVGRPGQKEREKSGDESAVNEPAPPLVRIQGPYQRPARGAFLIGAPPHIPHITGGGGRSKIPVTNKQKMWSQTEVRDSESQRQGHMQM